MAQSDGSIVFETEIDNSQAQKSLNQLTREIEKTEKTISRLEEQKSPLEEQFEKASAAAGDAELKIRQMKAQLSQAQAALSSYQGFDMPLEEFMRYQDIVKSMPDEISAQEGEFQKLIATVDKLNVKLSGYDDQLAQANEKLAQQTAEAGELTRQLSMQGQPEDGTENAASGAEKSAKRITRLKEASDQTKASMAGLEKAGSSVGRTLTSGAKAAGSAFVNLGRTAVAALASIGRAAVSAFAAAGRSIVSFVGHMNVFSKLASGLSGKISRLGTMIKQAFVFNVISQGLNALRSQMSSYLSTNAAFTGALSNLQASLSTAFQPILDAAVPALVKLMEVLSSVIAVIGRFLAALASIGGRARTNTKALGAQAKATGSAGGAAEKASKSLAKFDEINRLSDDSGGGGGGGGGGGAPEIEDFPEYEFDGMFNTWGEAFNAFLDTIIDDGLPRLRAALDGFAVWLNTLSANVYEMFTFPGVQEKIRYIGQEIAFAFNDMVNNIEWKVLGRALGAGLNFALGFLVSNLYSFNWFGLGQSLSTAFNGLVDEVRWDEFGQLLWSGFKIGLETLAGFLVGLDMPDVAQAFSNLVTGFFNAARDTVQKIEWDEIGKQIATFLNEFDWEGTLSSALGLITDAINGLKSSIDHILINWNWQQTAGEISSAINTAIENIPWYGIGETLGNLFTTALNFLLTAIARVNWAGLGAGLAASIQGVFASIRWDELGKNLGDAVISLYNGISGFITGMDWAKLASDLWNGLVEFVTGIDWGGVVSAMFNAFGAAVGAYASFAKGLAQAVWDTVINALLAVGEYFNGKIEECGGNVVAGIFKGIGDAILGIGSWIKENIFQPFIDGFKAVFGINSPSTVMAEQGNFIIQGLLQGLTQAWTGIVTFFSEKLEGIKTAISNAWTAIKNTATTAWTNIKSFLGNTWNNLKSTAGTVFNAAKDVIGKAWEGTKTFAINTWNNLKTSLSNTWNNIKTTAANTFNAAKEKIGEAWTNVKTFASNTWNAITTNLNTAWDGIKGAAETKFNQTKDAIGNAWEKTKSAASTIWDNVSSNLSIAWEGIKNTASNKFDLIKQKIAGTWRDSEKETSQKMEAIAIKVGAQAGFALKSVKDNFGKVTSSITTSLKSAQTAVQGLGWYGLGTGIVDGISAGVRAKAAMLAQSVANAAYNSMLAAKQALGINSPSRLFRDIIGAGMMEGAAVGVEENQKLVESSIYGMARDVTNDFADTLGMLDGMSGPTFDSVINGIQTLVQSVVSGVHEMIAALEGLRNVGGIFSQTLPTPKMASGTILPQSREFLSAISVQSSGAEGVSEDTIRRIVREETGGSTELLRAILEAVRAGHVIEVDKRVLGKTVTQEQNRMTRSSGRSALLT